MHNLNQLQQYILQALQALHEKSLFNEAILAKKLRELAKIDSKKKAGVSLNDLEQALKAAAECNIHYSIRLNSANEILLIKTETTDLLNEECRHRRSKSEKSMELLTHRDLSSSSDKTKDKHSQGKNKNRTVKTKINIYSSFEELE